jgi:hypothetical protein
MLVLGFGGNGGGFLLPAFEKSPAAVGSVEYFQTIHTSIAPDVALAT